MATGLAPFDWIGRKVDAVRRGWLLYHLTEPEFAFMYDAPPDGEWVALDCETTGLNVHRDKIVAIGAVRIVGNRVLTSQRLELLVRPKRALSAAAVRVHGLRESDVAKGIEPTDAMRRLLTFIGSRPLVGYYLEFDVAMLNREIWRLLGVRLPQAKIDVSSMYYDWRIRQLPPYQRDTQIDLRFKTMMSALGLPLREAHDPLNDAVMAALAFVKLRALLGRR